MKYFIVLILLFINLSVLSQNLVPNSSFEELSSCPNDFENYNLLLHWSNPTNGTPCIFNSCSNGNAGVPSNIYGYQQSKDGNGYVGIALWGFNYREYIQVQLEQTLVANEKYYVSFYVNLSNLAICINQIGLYFSSNLIQENITSALNYTPQITNTNGFLADTADWQLISGTYLSNGNENYIIIGNFYDDAHTDTMKVGGTYGSFYYIDDVYVGIDTTVNINTDVQSREEEISLYPNPAKERVFIKTENSKPAEMFVYNIQGCLLHQQTFTKSTNIYLQNWPAGVYYVKIVTENGIFVRKILREGL
ncbi:MAG TPA: hypothetical protein DEH02_08675 [Bacteroidales bacterium]|nr:MAG: hypothetical protein A2X01_03405 [Bacteroidetes bacterium GWF2_35_48]HBX51124.1 hypothetical protein [Bacteroidales bacterium]